MVRKINKITDLTSDNKIEQVKIQEVCEDLQKAFKDCKKSSRTFKYLWKFIIVLGITN